MSSPKEKPVPRPSSPPHPGSAGFSVRAIVSLPILDRTATFSRNHKIGDALQSRLSLLKRDLRKFGLSLSTVKQLVAPPRLEISPVPNDIDGAFGELISSGTNQIAVITSLSPRPEENLVTLLKAGFTSTIPPPSTVNQDFTLRTVATLPALCYENDLTGTESHEIILKMFDMIARKLRRVLDLPSSILDAAAEFFDGLEMYPNMVEDQLPEDGQVASLREVFPEDTNTVLAIAPLKRQYYDLLLGLLENGLSYEIFPGTPVSSEDELTPEEIPPSSATSESGDTTPNEAPSVSEASAPNYGLIILGLVERVATAEHSYTVLKDKNNDLEGELSHWKNKYDNVQQGNADLEKQKVSLESENAALSSEKAKLKTRIEHLKRENKKLKRDNMSLLSDKADLERDIEESTEENASLKERLEESELATVTARQNERKEKGELAAVQGAHDKLLEISRAISRRSLLDKVRNRIHNKVHELPDDYLHPDAKLDPQVPSPETLSQNLRKDGSRPLSADAIRMVFGAETTMDGETVRRQANRVAHRFDKEDIREAVQANDLTEQQKSLFSEIFVFYWGHVPSPS